MSAAVLCPPSNSHCCCCCAVPLPKAPTTTRGSFNRSWEVAVVESHTHTQAQGTVNTARVIDRIVTFWGGGGGGGRRTSKADGNQEEDDRASCCFWILKKRATSEGSLRSQTPLSLPQNTPSVGAIHTVSLLYCRLHCALMTDDFVCAYLLLFSFFFRDTTQHNNLVQLFKFWL